MKLISLILFTALCGCGTLNITTPDGSSLKRTQFLTKTVFKDVEITLTNGTKVVIHGYMNDAIEGAAFIAREAARGAVEGMK